MKASKTRHGTPKIQLSLELLEDRTQPASLSLVIATDSIAEDAGQAATTATLTRSGMDNSQYLIVNLTSSDTTEATVESQVVIAPGQTSTTFDVNAVDDIILDGTQTVTITGSATISTNLTIDAPFGGNGKVTQSFMTSAVAVQADSKVVVAGLYRTANPSSNFYDFAVSRYHANGTLDTTFGGSGTVITDVTGQSDKPQAIVVQTDGKIVVGGIGYDGPNFDFILARYNSDGTLDVSFGVNGKVTIDLGPGSYNELWDLALQPDGKILAGGNIDDGDPTFANFAVVRYNANGTLDTSFGSGGIAKTSFGWGDRAFGIALQNDGKIVLAGGSNGGNSISNFALARFTAAGVLDSTFGTGGKVQTNIAGDFEYASDVVIQPDGKIVAVGYVSPTGVFPPSYNFVVARYHANGALDSSFGSTSSGVTVKDFGGDDQAIAVGLQPDGKILVAGQTASSQFSTLARFSAFGVFESSLAYSSGTDPESMAVTPTGRVYVAGTRFTPAAASGYVDAYSAFQVLTASDTVDVTDNENAPPVANNDGYSVDEDQSLTINAPGVLANDTDLEGDPLTAVRVTNPAHGTVITNADGSFSYTPNANYNGTDSFTYKAYDGQFSNVATVTITINAVNDAPVAQNDSYGTDEDTQLTVNAPGVLANDSDVDGDSLAAILVSGPTRGSLTLNANGSFTYTPNANVNGTDSFTYKANDGALDSNLATVTITINAVNDAPVAQNDAYATDEDTPLTVNAPGVLVNDSDVDGDSLTAILVSGPTRGSLTLNANGSFTYTPNANFNGSDSFRYKANDGAQDSNVATVTITINPVQDPPVANAGPDQTVNEAATVAFDGSGSYDVDGDSLTYSWTFGDGGSGSGPTPSHVYADNGAYTVTLTVNDGHGNSSSDTLVVTVNNVAPSAGLAGPATGVRGQTRMFTFTANDVSPVDQAGTFTYSINWGDGSGTQSVQGPASVQAGHVFTASGSFTVTVTATDKDGGASLPSSRSITIIAVEMQGNVLVVGGTLGGDTILIKPSDVNGNLVVTINGSNQGAFAPTEQIHVFAQAGNDMVQLQSLKNKGTTTFVEVSAILFGAAGNDTVDARGSVAHNVLVGGDGADVLWGGGGREILLGGLAADVLHGGGEDDILIGGTTDFDANRAALTALLAEWSRDLSYQARIDHLTGAAAGGVNGANLLTSTTVHDDAAVDQLHGEAGQDWFLYQAAGPFADVLNDKKRNELATPI